MKKIIVFSLLMLVSSCSLPYKINKAKVLAVSHPGDFAGFCAATFPVKEVFVKGKDSIRTDTLFLRSDSVPCPPAADGRVIKIPCPPQRTVTKTIIRVDTLLKENTAKAQSLSNEINRLQQQSAVLTAKNKELARKAKNRLITICGLLLALVGSSILLKLKLF